MKRFAKTLFMMAMVIITAFGIVNTVYAGQYDYNNYEIDPEMGYIIVNTVDNTKTEGMACVNLYVYDLPKSETKAAKRQGFFMTFDCLTPDIFPKGEYYNEDDPLFFLEFKNDHNPGEEVDAYKNLTGDLHLYRMYLEPGQYCFQYYQFYENTFLTQNYGSCYDKANFDKNNRDVWDITADKVYTLYCLNAPSKELYEAHYEEYAAFAKANDSYRFGEDNNGEYSEQQQADMPTFEDYKNQGVSNSFTINDIIEETQDANIKDVSIKDIERMFEGSGIDLDAKYIGGGKKLPEKYYETHDDGTNRLVIWERLNGYSLSWDDLEGDKEPLDVYDISLYNYLKDNGYVKEDTEAFYEALLTLHEFAANTDVYISKADIENIFEGVDIELTPEVLINISIRPGKHITSLDINEIEHIKQYINNDLSDRSLCEELFKVASDDNGGFYVKGLTCGMIASETADFYDLDLTEYSKYIASDSHGGHISDNLRDDPAKDYELLAYEIEATKAAYRAYKEVASLPDINYELIGFVEDILNTGREHFLSDVELEEMHKDDLSNLNKVPGKKVIVAEDNEGTEEAVAEEESEVVTEDTEEEVTTEEKKPFSPIILIIGAVILIGGIIWGQIAKRK